MITKFVITYINKMTVRIMAMISASLSESPDLSPIALAHLRQISPIGSDNTYQTT